MHVAVIGSGYVGLVAGACLAETGNDVICVDKDAEKIARLQRNEIPIYEPGLEPMVERNQAEGRLTFTTDIGAAIRSAKVIFIAVGTPPGEDGSADLQHVLGVAREIGRHMNEPKVVVTKSTVPVGTAEKVRAAVKSQTETPFAVCSNPEFLKEGAAIEDFMKPDRVVIGVDDENARAVMAELYAPFTRQGGNRILFMDIASAEVTKYAANAMLATRISFMNQMALFCELVGADVSNVRLGIGSDQHSTPCATSRSWTSASSSPVTSNASRQTPGSPGRFGGVASRGGSHWTSSTAPTACEPDCITATLPVVPGGIRR